MWFDKQKVVKEKAVLDALLLDILSEMFFSPIKLVTMTTCETNQSSSCPMTKRHRELLLCCSLTTSFDLAAWHLLF